MPLQRERRTPEALPARRREIRGLGGGQRRLGRAAHGGLQAEGVTLHELLRAARVKRDAILRGRGQGLGGGQATFFRTARKC